MKRILWHSQHEPLPVQLEELKRLFGDDVEVVKDPKPFASAEEIKKRYKTGWYDDIVVVVPLSVLAKLVELDIYPLWAQMNQIPENEPADVISIIRHWTREDLPSVEEILVEKFGKEFIERHRIYGAKNAKTMRLPVSDRETAKLTALLIEAFAGKEMPDFREVRSVVICGDPNSGKSVFAAILREALKTLGVKVAHLDLDKAAPTPGWYLDAEIAYKRAELLFSQGRISQEELDKAKEKLEKMAAKRKAMKRPWSIELAKEARQELLRAAQSPENEFVIGDIGGGKIKRDEEGRIIKITRLTAENARILEGADAVIIVSNNPEGIAEWIKLIEAGEDPETGVRINRDKPIQIIGVYQSILEGEVQRVGESRNEAGVITNLDRSKAERKYNPSVFTTAVFISNAVEQRRRSV